MQKKQILERVLKIIFKDAKNGSTLTENSIAKRLNISRTPVREVLGRLEEEGVLERKQRKGIVLQEPSLKEIVEIYDLRSALEGLACRLLARTIDEATLKKLREICYRFNEAWKRRESGSQEKLDEDFHRLILTKCNNERLQRMVDNLHILSQCFRIVRDFELRGLDIRKGEKYSHESIVKALEKKDPEQAELIAKLHIQEGKMEIIDRFFGSSILPIYQKQKP